MNEILSGLAGNMTDEQLQEFADNLLRPQLNAALEESRQNYETTKLSKEQEIENLARQLTRSIDEQNSAYRQSAANVETAALSRGMGRSSYTLQTLANQGDALAKAVRELTDENTRQTGQIQEQITRAARQNSQTQGRLNTDFAAQLAAKVQELKESQRKEWNSNYLTAISSAMGTKTSGSQTTTGSQQTTGSQTTTGEQQTTGSQTTSGSQTTTGEQQTTGSQTTTGTSDTTGKSSSSSSSSSTSVTTSGSGSSGTKKSTPTTTTVNTRQVNGRYSAKNTSAIR